MHLGVRWTPRESVARPSKRLTRPTRLAAASQVDIRSVAGMGLGAARSANCSARVRRSIRLDQGFEPLAIPKQCFRAGSVFARGSRRLQQHLQTRFDDRHGGF